MRVVDCTVVHEGDSLAVVHVRVSILIGLAALGRRAQAGATQGAREQIVRSNEKGEKTKTVVTGGCGGQNRLVAGALGMMSRDLPSDRWKKHSQRIYIFNVSVPFRFHHVPLQRIRSALADKERQEG